MPAPFTVNFQPSSGSIPARSFSIVDGENILDARPTFSEIKNIIGDCVVESQGGNVSAVEVGFDHVGEQFVCDPGGGQQAINIPFADLISIHQ